MPRYYLHQHLNGLRTEDEHGKIFRNVDEACSYAVRRTPAHLRRAVRNANNNYFAIEVTNGRRTCCIIRGRTKLEKA
jgi:Domain of unknown function (DUF6894)